MGASDLPSVELIELERTASNTRVIEIIFGIFGAFGLGWLYAGNIVAAIVVMLFSLIYSIFAWSVVVFTGGICVCLVFPLSLAIAFVSGNNARAWAMKSRAQGSVLRILVGLAVFIVAVFIGVGMLGALIAGFVSQYNPVQ